MRADPSSITWAELDPRAKAFRVAHAAWAILSMASLWYVWLSAATRRRDRLLAASVTFLSLEGIALIVGRGNCPFGPFQRRLGDPVPLFELVLPPRAAKAAIPVLAAVTLTGFVAAAIRGPRQRHAERSGPDLGHPRLPAAGP
jgi:hypothetical protein